VTDISPVLVELTVACSVDHAFRTWTERASTWWPTDHTVSGAEGLEIVFEGHAGGRIYERAPDGSEHDWGRIVAWEPPSRLGYHWHLGGGADDATEVEVTFDPAGADGDATRVRIEHRGWERFGADADARRQRNDRGWTDVLPAYATAVTSSRRS